MKQFVLMNKQNGLISPAIRVTLTDNTALEEPLCKMEGYSMILRSSDFDGWLIFSGNPKNPDDHSGPWLYFDRKFIEERAEMLGEL